MTRAPQLSGRRHIFVTHAPQLSGRRHIFVTPVAAVSLQRGRKRGGREGGCPPTF